VAWESKQSFFFFYGLQVKVTMSPDLDRYERRAIFLRRDTTSALSLFSRTTRHRLDRSWRRSVGVAFANVSPRTKMLRTVLCRGRPTAYWPAQLWKRRWPPPRSDGCWTPSDRAAKAAQSHQCVTACSNIFITLITCMIPPQISDTPSNQQSCHCVRQSRKCQCNRQEYADHQVHWPFRVWIKSILRDHWRRCRRPVEFGSQFVMNQISGRTREQVDPCGPKW
jgi:hypothetical protein